MSRTSSHASIDRQTAPGKGLSAIAVALPLLLLGACVGPKGEEKPARAPGAVEAAAPAVLDSVTNDSTTNDSVTNGSVISVGRAEKLAVPPPEAAAQARPSTPDAEFRQKRPEPAAAQAPFAAPVPVERKLKSGARLLVVESHHVPLVAIEVLIGTGVDGEPEGRGGLAAFTAGLLREGTRKRPSLQLDGELEDLAAHLTTRASLETSAVRLNCLRETLPQALDLLADVLQNPAFAKEDVERVRGLLLTGLLQKRSSAVALAADEVARRAWGEQHPWGQPAGGTAASLEKIAAADLVKFHDSYYRPNNAIVSVAGDVTPAEIHKLLEARLAGWKPKPLPKLKPPPPPALLPRAITLVDEPGASQAQIWAFVRGSPAAGPDALGLRVANAILGGQFGSRLNQTLREAKGYTYGARSRVSELREAGLVIASGGFRASVTAESLAALVSEFAAFETGALREGELERARESLARAVPTALESVDAVAGSMALLAFQGLPLDDYRTLPERVAKVDAAEVARVAKQYLGAGGLQVVVVGPRALAEEKLRALGLGPVEVPGDPPLLPPVPPASTPPAE